MKLPASHLHTPTPTRTGRSPAEMRQYFAGGDALADSATAASATSTDKDKGKDVVSAPSFSAVQHTTAGDAMGLPHDPMARSLRTSDGLQKVRLLAKGRRADQVELSTTNLSRQGATLLLIDGVLDKTEAEAILTSMRSASLLGM